MSNISVYRECPSFLQSTINKALCGYIRIDYYEVCNNKGKEYFYQLMAHYSDEIRPFFFEFNAMLFHIDLLSKEKGLERLHAMQNQLHQLKKWIIAHEIEAQSKVSFAKRMIIKQYRMVIVTLVQWIDEAVEEYGK